MRGAFYTKCTAHSDGFRWSGDLHQLIRLNITASGNSNNVYHLSKEPRPYPGVSTSIRISKAVMVIDSATTDAA